MYMRLGSIGVPLAVKLLTKVKLVTRMRASLFLDSSVGRAPDC